MTAIMKTMAKGIAEFWLDENEVPYDEETRKASRAVYEIYWDDARFADMRSDLERKITQECTLRERQGFIAGFEYAVELLSKGGI